MKVGDLVKLKGDDIRGIALAYRRPIPAGTMGVVVRPPNDIVHEGIHRGGRPFVKLFPAGETRPFLAYELEVISESR